MEIILRVDRYTGARVVGEIKWLIGETPNEEADIVKRQSLHTRSGQVRCDESVDVFRGNRGAILLDDDVINHQLLGGVDHVAKERLAASLAASVGSRLQQRRGEEVRTSTGRITSRKS